MKLIGHQLLPHLTERQINTLIELYDAGTKIAVLKTQFNIECGPNNLYRLLPPLVRTSDPCPNCDAAMTKPRPSRSHSANMREKKTGAWRCTKCKHIDFVGCRCDYCQSRQRRRKQNHKSVIEPVTGNENVSTVNSFKPHDLTLEQVTAFLALVLLTWQDNTSIFPSTDDTKINAVPFAPLGAYGAYLLEQLVNANLLLKRQLDVPAFTMAAMTSSTTFAWNMPLDSFVEQMSECIENETWPDHWITETYKVAYSIATAECIEFFNWCITQRNFSISDSPEIIKVVTDLLNVYSVSQCQYIIIESAKATAEYFIRTDCDSLSFVKYMAEHCKILSNESKSNSFDAPKLERNNTLPRSAISHVFYEIFLPDYDGYTSPLIELKINLLQH